MLALQVGSGQVLAQDSYAEELYPSYKDHYNRLGGPALDFIPKDQLPYNKKDNGYN